MDYGPHQSPIASATLAALSFVSLLLGFSLAPSAAAQQPAAVTAVETSSAQSAGHAEQAVQCQTDLLLGEAALIDCRWCNLDNCGCIALPGCVLYYSCGCSIVDCWHVCLNKFCPE